MKNKLLFYILLLLTIGVSISLAQNNGSVKGRILNSDGDPLPYANAIIVGTSNGAAADFDGYFTIRNVSPGQGQIEISYLGYVDKVIDISVVSDKILDIEDILLENEFIEGEEVLITAQAQGQLDAINRQIQSTSIVNIVAKDRLQENPDANAAEALGRLPGVSVTRSGGEASDFVIRGMNPKYNTVTLEGIELPSNKDNARNASISGISQYSLEGVELFKSITADMEGSSVSGTVNLKLKEADEGLNASLLVRPGYNNQNDYWENYTISGEISNRFFDNKLGIKLVLNTEQVNRSTQNLTAGYGTIGAATGIQPLFINGMSLNNIDRIISRQSASLIFDYALSQNSKIKFFNFYKNSSNDNTSVDKNYSLNNNNINYYLDDLGDNSDDLFLSALQGEQIFGNLKIDYGVSFAQSKKDRESRNWHFEKEFAFPDSLLGNSKRETLSPQDYLQYTRDEISVNTLKQFTLRTLGATTNNLSEDQITTNIDFTYDFKLTNNISGFLKTGIKYKNLDRTRKYDNKRQYFVVNAVGRGIIDEEFDWITLNNSKTGIPASDDKIDNFLQGGYDFGWLPDFGKLNDLTDFWDRTTEYYNANPSEIQTKFGNELYAGYWSTIDLNDYGINDNYYATYLMSELNFSDLATFIPGIRYEKTVSDLKGATLDYNDYVEQWGINLNPDAFIDREVTEEREHFLPMIHLVVKPLDYANVKLSYTKTLHRPNYNQLIPSFLRESGINGYAYSAGNPNLRPEVWQNFDLQVSLFNNQIGLFSIGGFYKEVTDHIWARSYTTLVTDPPIEGFPEGSQVDVRNEFVNHPFKVLVRGGEVEWQTNFWYLPGYLSHITLSLNYTYTNNETKYFHSETFTEQVGVDNRGRPQFELVRSDTILTGPMTQQPEHTVNVSLGYNYKGFNAWLSFQYNDNIFQSKRNLPELDIFKDSFSRWDLQITQKLPLDGLDLLFNIANISDLQEILNYRYDSRPSSIENYGWTADLGIRYRL